MKKNIDGLINQLIEAMPHVEPIPYREYYTDCERVFRTILDLYFKQEKKVKEKYCKFFFMENGFGQCDKLNGCDHGCPYNGDPRMCQYLIKRSGVNNGH